MKVGAYRTLPAPHRASEPDAVAEPFHRAGWVYEEKYDGRRTSAVDRSRPVATRSDAEVAGSDVLLARRLAADGLEAWQDVQRRECEGLVAKPEASPYLPGVWKKLKVCREGAFYVLGVLQSEGRFAGIVVGAHDGGEMSYAGVVEYGFSRRGVAELLTRARALVRRQAPLPQAASLDVLWLEPRLVALVMYLEQVSGRLREPVYRGLIDRRA